MTDSILTTSPSSLVVADQVTLRFGGVGVRFCAVDKGTKIRLSHPHTSFLVPDDSSVVCEVVCESGEVAHLGAPTPSDPSEVREERYDAANGTTTVFFYGRRRTGEIEPYLCLTIAADFRTMHVIQAPIAKGDPLFRLGFPLDEYIMGRLLGRSGALILHACAVVSDGRAFAFAGHSGAGKSTIAELAEGAGATILSDDRTILRVEDDAVVAWGSPWHGSYHRGNPAKARLHALFLLVQAQDDVLRPIEPATAFKELFVRLIQPTREPSEVLDNIETLERVVSLAPAAELHFRPTVDAFALALRFAQ